MKPDLPREVVEARNGRSRRSWSADQRRLFEAVARAIRVEAFSLVYRKQDVDARKMRHGGASHRAQARRLGFSIQAPRA